MLIMSFSFQVVARFHNYAARRFPRISIWFGKLTLIHLNLTQSHQTGHTEWLPSLSIATEKLTCHNNTMACCYWPSHSIGRSQVLVWPTAGMLCTFFLYPLPSSFGRCSLFSHLPLLPAVCYNIGACNVCLISENGKHNKLLEIWLA